MKWIIIMWLQEQNTPNLRKHTLKYLRVKGHNACNLSSKDSGENHQCFVRVSVCMRVCIHTHMHT